MRRGVGGGYCPARTANREPRTEHREPSAEHREPPTACRKIREVGSLPTAHRPPPTAHAIAPPPSTSTVDPVA
ncbi:hypothetical protein D0U02_32340 [Burkholderia pseudomallei]|nr:hypothetical protein D0U02_32340 [Burkholderia pseudomallei]RFS55910.1 hypothetical protein D0U01_31085 [Burkholderia pseudomallei]RFS61687.1 hypothetical protein D0U05_02740 [Burkholderia pseudomallei]RFS75289.1 hypothetical protein D0T98_05395 [Burkholderia pseudomallei]